MISGRLFEMAFEHHASAFCSFCLRRPSPALFSTNWTTLGKSRPIRFVFCPIIALWAEKKASAIRILMFRCRKNQQQARRRATDLSLPLLFFGFLRIASLFLISCARSAAFVWQCQQIVDVTRAEFVQPFGAVFALIA